jgi:hypothetical protein
MKDRPAIKTAIPKRRYQIGDFSATLLGEIEAGDARNYRYILAFVHMGHAQPSLYVCSEQTPPARAAEGRYGLRVINDVMSEMVDSADRWGDLDAFADQGIQLGVQALGLRQEQVMRLM